MGKSRKKVSPTSSAKTRARRQPGKRGASLAPPRSSTAGKSTKRGSVAVGGALQAMDLASRDAYKLGNTQRVVELKKALQGADAGRAATIAENASKLRNVARAATQGQLTPVGKVLSKLLEKDRSWASIIEKYGDPFDTKLPAKQRAAIADRIVGASGKSSRAMNALQAFGKALMIANVAIAATQVGTGIDKVINDEAAEGAVDIAEGATNIGLTTGTYAGIKSGTITASGGLGGLGAGLLAAGGLALGFEETRRAIRGEKTAAAEATEFYADMVIEGEKEGGASGALKQVGGWTGGFFSGIVSGGQELFD